MQQRRNPTTVSQMMAQIRDLQNKVNSLSDARVFYDPESGSSSGATHVPDETSTILSSRKFATPRLWIAPKYTELYGYYGKRFLNAQLSKKDNPLQSSTTQRIWHFLLRNWDMILQGQEGKKESGKENR